MWQRKQIKQYKKLVVNELLNSQKNIIKNARNKINRLALVNNKK